MQPAQLGEHVAPLAAGPAFDEQLVAPVAQHQTAPAVQRADAAPVAALAAGAAEPAGDLLGRHRRGPVAVSRGAVVWDSPSNVIPNTGLVRGATRGGSNSR